MDEPTSILTTEDVTITTLAVEVKVMKIGKRQVTLAVFRQLPDEPILSKITGELIGIPWGRVNYCPDCKDAFPHFHIVWQKGNELRRAALEKRWETGPYHKELLWEVEDNPYSRLHGVLQAYLCTHAIRGWLPDESKKKFDIPVEKHTFHVSIDDLIVYLTDLWKAERNKQFRQKSLDDMVKRGEQESHHSYYQEYLTSTQKRYDEAEQTYQKCLKAALDYLVSEEYPQEPDSLYDDFILPAYKEYMAYIQRWRQSYAQLEALDQLFIAV